MRSSTPSSLVPDPMSFAIPQKAVLNDNGSGYSCPACASCFTHCRSEQWGLWASDDATYADITYPISFTQRTIAVVATDWYYSDVTKGPGVILCVAQPRITKTGCRIIGAPDTLGTFQVIIIGQ